MFNKEKYIDVLIKTAIATIGVVGEIYIRAEKNGHRYNWRSRQDLSLK
jgi:hypothetical protein